MTPSVLPLALSLLPLKRLCSLSRTETAIPNPKFGVYVIYIYIYICTFTHTLWALMPVTDVNVMVLSTLDSPWRELGTGSFACSWEWGAARRASTLAGDDDEHLQHHKLDRQHTRIGAKKSTNLLELFKPPNFL